MKKETSNLKKDDIVDYHSTIGGPITKERLRVRCDPYEMCGSLVVMVEGICGCVSCEALTLSEI